MIELNFKKLLKGPEGAMLLDIQQDIKIGDFTCIYGPSGAGKTSTLNIIAGLLDADQGTMKFNQTVWYNSNTKRTLPPRQRGIGYVFQEHALFPNMSVIQNLEFAQHPSSNKSLTEELIEIMGLGSLLNHKPDQLSGGQKQRVALARSITQEPKLLLLDEPLSSLDTGIRLKLQRFLKEIHNRLNLTTIMISHDVSEIIKLADTLWMIQTGKITKSGSPIRLFTSAKSTGEFQFTGEIIAIEKQDIVYILTLLIDHDLVKVVADETEVQSLNIGDKVLASSKAFNPIITKISSE